MGFKIRMGEIQFFLFFYQICILVRTNYKEVINMSYISKDYIDLNEGIMSSLLRIASGKKNVADVSLIIRKDLPKEKQLKNIKKRKESIRKHLAKKGTKLGKVRIIYVRDEKHKKELIRKMKKAARKKKG